MTNSSKTLLLSAGAALMLATGSSEAATTHNGAGKTYIPQEEFMRQLAAPSMGLAPEAIDSHDNTPFLRTRQSSPDEETLLEMDFSGFSDGSETELGTYITEEYETEGNPYIAPGYVNGQEGWWGAGVYSAGGACALALPNFGGAIATPMMNLYGNLHVSLRVKIREGNKTAVPLFITLASTDIWHPLNPIPNAGVTYVTFKPEDSEKGWMDVSVDIMCPYNYDDAYIQFNAVSYCKAGMLIDDIKITRDYDFISEPSEVAFHNFSSDGFSASWTPGAENKEWLVNLLEETTISEDEVSFSEDFENCSDDTPWLQGGASITSGNGTVGSKALAIDNDDEVAIPVNYANLSNLSFRLSTDGINEESPAAIAVRTLQYGQWSTIVTLRLRYVSEDGNLMDFAEDIDGFSGHFSHIKLVAVNFSEGETAVIDDLSWSTLGAYERKPIADNRRHDSNEISFDGIDMTKKHYFQVSALNGDIQSDFTNLEEVRGIAAPVMKQATEIDNENRSYTANWEPVAEAESYTISNYAVRTMSAEKDKTVFHDSFANAHGDGSGLGVLIDEDNFDSFADNIGWTADGGELQYVYVEDSRIGSYVINSPEISLHNNGGRFTLRFSAYVYGNSHVMVRCGNQLKSAEIQTGYDPFTGEYEEGSKEIEMTFDNGSEHTTLSFHTHEGRLLSIANVSVSQDIIDGDKFYELIQTDTASADKTSFSMKNLPASGDLFAYHVSANRSYTDGESLTSDYSNNMTVDLRDTSAALETDSHVVVLRDGNDIEVILPAASGISVFSASGAQVAEISGIQGVNRIAGLPKGIYVVKAANRTSKVIL